LPQELAAWVGDQGLSPYMVLWAILVFYLVFGCVMDSLSMILLTVPIFWPIAQALGFDPITFALVGILIIEAGVLTPPFGIAVFVVRAAVPDSSIRIQEIFVGAAPYATLILVVAACVWFFPPLATWLPAQL
jgi:TRAP-type C4-dicarboxylate transport system permease large subunit